MRSLLSLILLALCLSSCISKPVYEPIADQGITCRMMETEKGELPKKTCLSVDYNSNPVRFHYVAPWELDQLPPMPDLN